MKYSITQSRFAEVITQYLDSNWYPDYGWVSHEDYKRVWETWNEVEFTVNDEPSYILQLEKHNITDEPGDKVLLLFPIFYDKMNDLFNDKWEDIFADWFKTNTGLNFDEISYY